MLHNLLTFGLCCFTFAAASMSAYAGVASNLPTGLTGFEVEREVANKLLGPTTTERSQARIFLTVSQDFLYAQTNYVAPQYSYPTKLAARSKIDLLAIVFNLLHFEVSVVETSGASQQAIETIDNLIKESITLFIEREPIQNSIFSNLLKDSSRCKSIVWVSDRPNVVKPMRGQVNIDDDLKKVGNVPIKEMPISNKQNGPYDNQGGGQRTEPFTLQIIAVFIFGIFFIVTLIVLAICFPHPTNFQYGVFRIILAVAASGVAAMIPGFLMLDLNPGYGVVIRAAGALAVFVMVYFFNPAKYALGEPTEADRIDSNPIGERNGGDSRRFSVKDGQDFKLGRKLFAIDRCMYDIELSDPMIGDNAAKFMLRVYKHVVGQPIEMTQDESHGLSCGENVSIAPPWHLALEKVERQRAYFVIKRM